MAQSRSRNKQRITIQLSQKAVKSAKLLASEQGLSLSAFLAREIEPLINKDQAYEGAKRRALALLDKGFHLGGVITADREQLHQGNTDQYFRHTAHSRKSEAKILAMMITGQGRFCDRCKLRKMEPLKLASSSDK